MVLGGGGRGWPRFGGGSWPVHSDVIVMGIRVRAWFVGLQQRWSVRLRVYVSLVQLHYDVYYSRHNITYECLQMYNGLVVSCYGV